MEEEMTLGEIGRRIERLDARVQRVLDDHESRLRRAEKWVYALPPTFILACVALLQALIRGAQ